MSGMIAPLLPKDVTKNPMVLETEVEPGMHLFIGATGKLSSERPGNGGFRIWKYNNKDDAAAEVLSWKANHPFVPIPIHKSLFRIIVLVAKMMQCSSETVLTKFWRAVQAIALAQGMEVKHMVYNTGCAGAKVRIPFPSKVHKAFAKFVHASLCKVCACFPRDRTRRRPSR